MAFSFLREHDYISFLLQTCGDYRGFNTSFEPFFSLIYIL